MGMLLNVRYQVGTFQIALVAGALGKPVHVAVESFKFTRIFPLNQADMPGECLRAILFPISNWCSDDSS